MTTMSNSLSFCCFSSWKTSSSACAAFRAAMMILFFLCKDSLQKKTERKGRGRGGRNEECGEKERRGGKLREQKRWKGKGEVKESSFFHSFSLFLCLFLSSFLPSLPPSSLPSFLPSFLAHLSFLNRSRTFFSSVSCSSKSSLFSLSEQVFS